MLEWQWWGVHFRLSLWFPAMVIAMLSWDSSGVTAFCLLASVIHEGGHLAAMLLVRDVPSCITLSAFGMRVERRRIQHVSYPSLCAVSLAGPLTNAVCAVVLWLCGAHESALIHGVLAGFHLLPVTSLDGGEALYALLCCRLSEERAERVLFTCSAVIVFPLAVLGFSVLLRGGYNFSLLLVSGYLILRMFLHKGH